MKKLITTSLALLAATCGLSAWALSAGDTVTWSNTGTSGTLSDSVFRSCQYSLCLPEQDGLPEGSVVKVTSVKLASWNTTLNYWDTTNYKSDAHKIILNGVTSDEVTLTADGISVTSDTSASSVAYAFTSECNITVGTTYAAPSGTNKSTSGQGITMLHSNGNANASNGIGVTSVRHVSATTGAIGNSAADSGYYPVYEITATVVSIPTIYSATIDGDTEWTNITWSPALPEDLSEATLKLTGSGTVLNYNGAAAGAEDFKVASGIALEYKKNYPSNVASGFTVIYDYETESGDYSASTTIENGGTLIVNRGNCTLTTGDRGIKGTLQINAGATVTATANDQFGYGTSGVIAKVYGTLAMGGYRWTTGSGNTIQIFMGGTITGTCTSGNIDMKAAGGGTIQVSANGENKGTVSLPCNIRSTNNDNGVITVDEGMTLDFSGNRYGTNKITKNGEGVLNVTAANGTYLKLSAGTITSASDSLSIQSGVTDKVISKSTVDGVTTYALADDTREAGDVYVKANDSSTFVLEDNSTYVTLIDGDVIHVNSSYIGNVWSFVPAATFAGHTVKIDSGCNMKGDIVATAEFVLADSISMYCYDSKTISGTVSGNGTIYLSHGGTSVLADGAKISCPIIMQNGNATITGSVTVSSTSVTGNKFMLADGATLTASADIADYVSTSVAEKHVVYNSESGVYSLADDEIASIGDTVYTTLAKAFAAATDGATIKVLADTSVGGIEITGNKSITLELGSNVITGTSGSDSIFTIRSGSSLTVNANNDGGFTTTVSPYFFGVDGGTLVVNGGTYATAQNAGILSVGAANITVNGGSISGICGIYVESGTGTVAITGGTITKTGVAASEDKAAVYADAGTVTITGGSVLVAEGVSGNSVGKFGESTSFAITGGSFTTDPSDCVATGYIATLDETTGLYTVEKGPVAQIGDVTYKTLVEAFAAVESEGTVTLIASTTEDVTIPAGVTLTISEGVTLTLDGGTAGGNTVRTVGAGAVINVKGTLDFGYIRWDNKSEYTLNVYAGATLQGTGNAETNNSACGPDFADAAVTVNACASDTVNTTIIDWSVATRIRHDCTFTVDEGVTLKMGDIVSGNWNYTAGVVTKAGAGTLSVTGSMPTARANSFVLAAGTIASATQLTVSTTVEGKKVSEDVALGADLPYTYTLVDDVTYLAQVGEDKYETLAAAFNAVAENGTVTLLADYESEIFPTKAMTLDLGAKTVGDITIAGVAVTVQNGTASVITIGEKGELVVNGTSIKNTGKVVLAATDAKATYVGKTDTVTPTVAEDLAASYKVDTSYDETTSTSTYTLIEKSAAAVRVNEEEVTPDSEGNYTIDVTTDGASITIDPGITGSITINMTSATTGYWIWNSSDVTPTVNYVNGTYDVTKYVKATTDYLTGTTIELDSDQVPAFAITEDGDDDDITAGVVTVESIPGLVYRLIGASTLEGLETASAITAVTATGATTTLDAGDGAITTAAGFYKVTVDLK